MADSRPPPAAFFVVYNPVHGAPRYRHKERAKAVAEAKRIASLSPGTSVYVLQATDELVFTSVSHVEMVPSDDEVPF